MNSIKIIFIVSYKMELYIKIYFAQNDLVERHGVSQECQDLNLLEIRTKKLATLKT